MDANCAEMEMEKNKKGLVFVGMELEMVTLKANSTLERRRLSESDSVATRDREVETIHSSASVRQRAHSCCLRWDFSWLCF